MALMGKFKGGKGKDKNKKDKKDKDKGSKDKKKNAGKGKGKDGKCPFCKKGIHAEENCWHRHLDKMLERIKKKQEANNNKKASISDGNRQCNKDTLALTAIMSAFVVNESSWIADTAATQHIYSDRSAL